jgi:nucleotide-binding universal stress UspA family protein
MRTILVPFDFSDAATNALNYAAEFAKACGIGEIVILHVYDYPVIPNEPVMMPDLETIKESRNEHLEDVCRKTAEKYPELHFTARCEMGLILKSIVEVSENADLVIMGMRGGGFLTEKLIGSTTTSLMRATMKPVIAIPSTVIYTPIKRIALASDYKNSDYNDLLIPLKKLIGTFDAHLYIVHIDKSEEKHDVLPDKKLQQALEDIPYTFHSLPGKDIAAGINGLIDDLLIDLAVVIPRQHSFFYSLIHEHNTKKLAFNTKVPLLSLHEKPE